MHVTLLALSYGVVIGIKNKMYCINSRLFKAIEKEFQVKFKDFRQGFISGKTSFEFHLFQPTYSSVVTNREQHIYNNTRVQ